MFLNKYFTVSIKKLFDAFNSKRCQHYSPDVGINITHNEHLQNHLMTYNTLNIVKTDLFL